MLIALLLPAAAAPLPPPVEPDPVTDIIMPMPPYFPPGTPLDDIELDVSLLVTHDGKPVKGASLQVTTCDSLGPVGMPHELTYRSDGRGRVKARMLFIRQPKGYPLKGYLCAKLWSQENTLVVYRWAEYDSSKPMPSLVLDAQGPLEGTALDVTPLDEKAELAIIRALRERRLPPKALAASMAARRSGLPATLISAMAEALNNEYDQKSPSMSEGIRRDLVRALCRYQKVYEARRSAVLLRAAREDPDENLRELATKAKNLGPR